MTAISVLLGLSGCGKSTLLLAFRQAEDLQKRRNLNRQHPRQRHATQRQRYRHGIPKLRTLPSYERLSKIWPFP